MILRGPLTPDPGAARDWLRAELSRREYRPSLLERVSDWFRDLIDHLQAATSGTGLGPVPALVLLVLLALGAVLLLSRMRRNPAPHAAERALFAEVALTSADHRARAQRALNGHEWDRAVVEATRALAAGLFERELVAADPRVTAHEITDRAAALFPDLGPRLRAASRVFDETRYGGRPADEQRARTLVALEQDVRESTPRSERPLGPVVAVPR